MARISVQDSEEKKKQISPLFMPSEVKKIKRTYMMEKELDVALAKKALDNGVDKSTLLNEILKEYLIK